MVKSFRVSSLMVGVLFISPYSWCQTPARQTTTPTAPGLIKLTGDDAERAAALDRSIYSAEQADRWDEAIARAEELLAVRTRAQGPEHFETIKAQWHLKALRQVAVMPKHDRLAYESANDMDGQAQAFLAQAKFAAAQPLFEKALEIRRRLLTDDHADTAKSYSILAANLAAQGKYAEARNRWVSAVKSLDSARLVAANTGLERAGMRWSPRPALAAVLARLGERSLAWRALEDDLGRGLLDELAAREDSRLTAVERARLRELKSALEKLDKLVLSTPKALDEAGRARRFEHW